MTGEVVVSTPPLVPHGPKPTPQMEVADGVPQHPHAVRIDWFPALFFLNAIVPFY
jgi:hypothetical protein